MKNYQIKLNIKEQTAIRRAIFAKERYHPVIMDKFYGSPEPIELDETELKLVKNSLELATQQEKNWLDAHFYRETYGKISAQTTGAHAQEDDFDRDDPSQDSPFTFPRTGCSLQET